MNTWFSKQNDFPKTSIKQIVKISGINDCIALLNSKTLIRDP
jgi:hypothetical protein